jgi:hypothetical protein
MMREIYKGQPIYMDDIPLYLPLKAGYGDKNASTDLQNRGYVRDNELSNHNQQVYYNKDKNKLLTNVTGTHNVSDWGTDAYLAVGKIQHTNRFREAKKTHEKAKQKYQGSNVVVTAHSLGSNIANYLSSDKTVNYNPGYSPFAKKRANVTNYRTQGDIVSLFAPKAKTLKNTNLSKDFLTAHKVSNLRGNSLYV